MADSGQNAVLDFNKVQSAIDKVTSDPSLLSAFDSAMQDLRSLVGAPLNGPEFASLVDHLVMHSAEAPPALSGGSGLGF